ncbi:conserved protein of unknown function [Pseudomonas marincola]|uniref:Uncharacterized protein n=1 Tax=Pseudomonas marincola TaxID=437900 RepID=A0A653E9A5_9PSED|nr:conserved protein of unknown function [Pseudomonas marincola]
MLAILNLLCNSLISYDIALGNKLRANVGALYWSAARRPGLTLKELSKKDDHLCSFASHLWRSQSSAQRGMPGLGESWSTRRARKAQGWRMLVLRYWLRTPA